VGAAAALSLAAGVLGAWSGPAGAVTVTDETTFRAAWSNTAETQIDLAADITLTCAGGGTAQRNSATALTLEGHGHSITQTCANSIALTVIDSASGASMVILRNVTITHGKATRSLAIMAATADASTDSNTFSEPLTVEVRKKGKPRPDKPRPDKPRPDKPRRRQPTPVPAAPAPAAPVLAVVRFTG